MMMRGDFNVPVGGVRTLSAHCASGCNMWSPPRWHLQAGHAQTGFRQQRLVTCTSRLTRAVFAESQAQCCGGSLHSCAQG